MSDSEEFGQAQSGGLDVIFASASTIRVGGYVVMKERPCRISEYTTAKTGKHGSAKIMFTGIDIFNNRKYEGMQPSTSTIQVPNVTKREYQLININDDNSVDLMGPDSSVKSDLDLPDEAFAEEIKSAFEKGDDILVAVQSAMGIEQIMSWKRAN